MYVKTTSHPFMGNRLNCKVDFHRCKAWSQVLPREWMQSTQKPQALLKALPCASMRRKLSVIAKQRYFIVNEFSGKVSELSSLKTCINISIIWRGQLRPETVEWNFAPRTGVGEEVFFETKWLMKGQYPIVIEVSGFGFHINSNIPLLGLLTNL